MKEYCLTTIHKFYVLLFYYFVDSFVLLSDAVDCEYIETESSDTALLTVAYVMAGVCGLCLLPIFVLLGQASCKKRRQQHQPLARSETEVATDSTRLKNDF